MAKLVRTLELDITDQLEQARELARQNADLREELALVSKQRDDIAETAQQRIDELENIVAAYEQYDQ